jgi:hypothetical protein
MITRRLMVTSVLLAFAAVPGSVQASPQPSDRAWWPDRTQAASGRANTAKPGDWQESPAAARSKSKAAKPKPDAHKFLGPRGFHH